MVARDPARPKASNLADEDVLFAVEDYCSGGAFPSDQFPHIPGKVFFAKVRKLQMRGLIKVYDDRGQPKYCLTDAGREVLGQ